MPSDTHGRDQAHGQHSHRIPASREYFPIGLDIVPITWYNTSIQDTTTTRQHTMITINNATVETLDDSQARPMGSTVLSVTIGDHTFNLLVDEDELIQALASQHGGTKPCLTPAP